MACEMSDYIATQYTEQRNQWYGNWNRGTKWQENAQVDQNVYVSVAKYISIRPQDVRIWLHIFKPKILSRKYDLYTKSEEEDDIPEKFLSYFGLMVSLEEH